MKKFINDPYFVVDEMLEGFLDVHQHYVRKLEDVRSVARTDCPVVGKVGIVTGGGSGHEPAFLGFVGKGMLDSVAVGEIFTSPPPLACIEAVKAANGEKGVLLIVGNYAGDIMNFKLAADMAKAEGIDVEQVILTDDVGSAPKGEESRRRGVSGAFLAWKVAGAKAATGANLQKCKASLEKLNNNTRTIGVAISPCTVPAKGSPTFILGENEMEYGVGHHGEAGTEKIKMTTVDEIADRMTREIIEDLPFQSNDEVALLINGLGGTPRLELFIAYRKVKQMLDERGIKVGCSYVDEYFTGLEMAGFSITITKLDEELKTLLTAPADTPYYKR